VTTATQVIEEVHRLAEEQPDFVYSDQEVANEECSYFGCAIGNTTGQACIVGQALANLNVDMSDMKRKEDTGYGMAIATALEEGVVDIPYTEEEAKWLGDVQYYQDRGEPWAQAVALADKEFRPWN
jgi:hypothetical protein